MAAVVVKFTMSYLHLYVRVSEEVRDMTSSQSFMKYFLLISETMEEIGLKVKLEFYSSFFFYLL